MRDIAQSCTVDQKFFWYLVRKRRGKNNNVIFQPTVDEQTQEKLYNEDDIIRSWGEYYKNLFTPSIQEHYDDAHKTRIRDDMTELLDRASNMSKDKSTITEFTIDDVKKIGSMKRGKAAGVDGVYYEHILYGPDIMTTALVILFNSINVQRHVPSVFKNGVNTNLEITR